MMYLILFGWLTLLVLALWRHLDIGRLLADSRGAVLIRGELGANAGMSGPAGPVVDALQGKLLYGETAAMVAGVIAEVLSVEDAQGIPDGFPLIIPWHKSFAGATGILRASYVAATRTLTITSSSATDTGTAAYLVLLPH
jgi:hypothetical protein